MSKIKIVPAEQLAAKFTITELKRPPKSETAIELHMEALIAISIPQGTQVKTFGTASVIEELFEIDGYWITRTTEPSQDGVEKKISYQLIPE